ncbi:polyamine-transporting ATPase 13A3-like [Festucalex cinctus]
MPPWDCSTLVSMNPQEVKLINKDLEDEMEVWGYRPCLWKRILVGVGAVCSGGLLLLLLYWLPEWGVKATCTLTSLKEAQTLLLRTTVHYFIHHSIKYYWNEETQNFGSFKGLEDTKVKCAAIHTNHSFGLTKTLQHYRALFFGENKIDVKIPPLPKLFVQEVLNPFYILELFAVILWAVEDYYHYSVFVFLMATILIATSLYTIRKHYVILHNMVVEHSMVRVSVCRGNEGKFPYAVE